ncbi:MAG: hypothetical protein K2P58_01620 [Hyphomonadaceae bacterium]|nr:hypothetical protein [Hyphomonadaceae bacterium]
MRSGRFGLIAAAARFYAPLMVLFAMALLFQRAPGGVGFAAGLVIGAGFALQAAVFGVAAARRALPPLLARWLLAIGIAFTVAGAAFPLLPYAPQLMEAGGFLVCAAATALIAIVFFGRVPTLSDAEW